MRKRTAHRWRLTATMLLLTFLAFGTFWLVEELNRSGEQIQADLRLNEPDYIIERFSFVRMTDKGQPSYIISGDKLTHRPIDDSSEIDQPIVRSLAGDQPPMNMRAERARVDEGNSRVKLMDKVLIERLPSGRNERMQLRTEALTIFPDEDRMETDQPVQMNLGGATARGSGMQANNATRQVHLDGRGTIVYPPAAKR